MLLSSFMLKWSDLADLQMLAAAVGSASLAAIAGVQAARQMHAPTFMWPSALLGAASTVFSLMPSMFLCGSVGGGLYALLAMSFQIESNFVGQTVVVIATALGCALLAWVVCLTLLSAPAVVLALRRRTLRKALREGESSGPSQPFDPAEFKRAMRQPRG